MTLLENRFNLSSELYSNQKIVIINDNILKTKKISKEEIKKCFLSINIFDKEYINGYNLFFAHILLNSINYCYWYGNYKFRPNGMSSSGVTKLINQVFIKSKDVLFDLNLVVDFFKKELSMSGITMLEERLRHIDQVIKIESILNDFYYSHCSDNIQIRPIDSLELVELLVKNIPSYANDILLKRAVLTPMTMERDSGILLIGLDKLFLPADYQVPKILRYLGILEYSNELSYTIDNEIQILKNSKEEIAIRTSSIIAVDRLAKHLNLTSAQIDAWLFEKAHTIKEYPHHLTLTTDY